MADNNVIINEAAPAASVQASRALDSQGATHPLDQDCPLYDSASFNPTPRWKRFFDIGASLILIVLLAPLALAIAVWIRWASSGPVFFRQLRAGAQGELFRIWKFRTMRPANRDHTHRQYVASHNGKSHPVAKPSLEDELIPMGGFLRDFAIDELPQLINVLKGEMSLVGPRPDLLELDDYMEWQRHRFDVVPGMTGLWQVSGKNRLTFDDMIHLDIAYTKQRSPWFDAKLIFWTIPTLLGYEPRNDSFWLVDSETYETERVQA